LNVFLQNVKNINFLLGKKNDVFKYIENSIEKNEKTWIITLNALMYMEYFKNSDYKKCIESSSFNIPDGVSVVKKLKKLNFETERITGIDTLNYLLKISELKKYKVFFLGSQEEIIKKAFTNTNLSYNNVVCGYNNGFFNYDDEEKIIKKINNLETDILFVGMGIPKQELFILKNHNRLNVRLFMGVGGSFDVLSNSISRAPVFFQKFSVEWLYRMLKEPKRFEKFPDLIKFYFKKIN